jgi:hypothetical protein
VCVLTLLGDRISRITVFNDASLFPTFGYKMAFTKSSGDIALPSGDLMMLARNPLDG